MLNSLNHPLSYISADLPGGDLAKKYLDLMLAREKKSVRATGYGYSKERVKHRGPLSECFPTSTL